nr:photosystem II protein M [Euonymus oxyphyllus]UOF75302.1 photosystem II protein M [Euonymus oxyphyllus]
MEVNILAFIATALFILVPTAFLLIIYVKTISQTVKVRAIKLNET